MNELSKLTMLLTTGPRKITFIAYNYIRFNQNRDELEWLSNDNFSSPPFALVTYLTPFHKIRPEIQGKSLDHETSDIVTCKLYVVIDSVRLNIYPKYNAFLFDRVGDTKQNH